MLIDKIIEELENLRSNSTAIPWYTGDTFDDGYGSKFCSIGPYDMSDKPDKHPHEDTIAEFWGDNHNCEYNSKYAVAAVNSIPILIARIRGLETRVKELELQKPDSDTVERMKYIVNIMTEFVNKNENNS
jgi:hypothetical protein